MSQVLKEDVRNAIIEAAKSEFLEKGYKGASMRSIASKANMTVGNLYRYYKNKEDINLSIVAPTYKEIENAIVLLATDNVTLQPRVFNLKPDIKELMNKYDEFGNRLVDIYFKNKSEFNILMLHSRISEKLIGEFRKMVSSTISQSLALNNETDVLSYAYAKSMFSGLGSLFKDNSSDSDVLKIIVKTYLRSFLYMLDSGISKYTQ